MADTLSTILGTGALVGAAGWLVSHRLASRREEIARRDNAARSHLEAQIEQLYGPLLGLIQHSRIVFEVARNKLPLGGGGHLDFPRFSPSDGVVWRFFIETYFHPINARIRDLIRAKMHLLDEGILPEPFKAFFLHEVQFEVLYRLWKNKGVDSSSLKGAGWPPDFEQDVLRTLNKLRAAHRSSLQRLGASEGPPP